MPKNLTSFSVTMTDLLRACVSDADNFDFVNENTAAIDFFLYIVKYNKTDEFQHENLNRDSLLRTLMSHESPSDMPEISVLFDFLNLHLLKIDDKCRRENTYQSKSGNSFTQKPLPDLRDYCVNKLGLAPVTVKDLSHDSVIDIITICFINARHGLPFQNQPLLNLLSPTLKSDLVTMLATHKTKFTIIHGNANERKSRYMLKYVLHQLYNISYSTSYDDYLHGTFLEKILIVQSPKYADKKQDLYPAIFNSYLMHKKNHYFIIHSIASQKDLDTLINECKLCKNIILICDFDITSSQNSEFISYLSFQSFYVAPRLEDIKLFLENYHIDIDNPNDLSETLLAVSEGNIYTLHALELLVKNLWEKEKTGKDGKKEDLSLTERIELIEEFKNSLNNLSLEDDNSAISTEKFNMYNQIDSKRSGNSLFGHIRQLYKNILSADEWLLLLLVALHGEEGLSEQLLKKILPEGVFNKIKSLEDNSLISKTDNTYYYEDSLLIPYAFLYSKFSREDKEGSLFTETFSFLNFMLREICYYNTEPIDYSILCTTIKKTYKATFRLLHRCNDAYKENFTKILYYHIRYTKFLLDNGDISSVKELDEGFRELKKKLTQRPGRNKYWNTLYRIYLAFLEQRVQTSTNSSDSWEPYISLVDKLMNQIKQHAVKNKDFPDFWKLLLYLLEIILNYLLRLCISGVRNCRIFQTGADIELYAKKMLTIKEKSEEIFSCKIRFDDNDFLSEIKTSFNNIIQLSNIQCHNYISLYANELIRQNNLYVEPRYIQLSWFQKSCILLGELCYLGHSPSDGVKPEKVSYLQKIVTYTYIKLDTIPLDILEDYYYALINYTLAMAPNDTEKLLNYIHEDFERYEHIWQHSITMTRIKDIISEFHSKR